jgi:spore germination protein KA
MVYIRFFLLLSATMFGFFGLLLAMIVVMIHVINMRSFGIPVLTLAYKLPHEEVKDIAFRQPLWQLKLRPHTAADRTRMKDGGNGS